MPCSLLPLYNKYVFPPSSKEERGFFLYEIWDNQKCSIGLVCSICLTRDKTSGIFCHEKTYSQHAQKIYLEISDSKVQHNPILFITDDTLFSDLLNKLQSDASCSREIRLSSQVVHRLWKVNHYLKPVFLSEGICLADGHHRYDAIHRLLHEQKDKKEISLLAAVFPAHAVNTRRKGLALSSTSIDPSFILNRLSQLGELNTAATLNQKDSLYFFANHQWYQFIFNEQSKSKLPSNSLDIEILNELLFQQIPDLSKALRDQCFTLFPEGKTSLESDLPNKATWGFVLPADSVTNIIKLAKSGRILEPNSTFFDPKFINGLISHQLVINDY